MHLLNAARRVELPKYDGAERGQRLLTLLVRQQAPELVERQLPGDVRARGGAKTAILPDMGHLLGPIASELLSIQPAAVGQPARL
jgi:hypothetical protein